MMENYENLTLEEWCDGRELSINIFNNKYKWENETFMETIDRISGGNEKVKKLILEKKFLPGGRICANRGLDHKGRKVTMSNCYVMNPIEDNIESIFDTAKELARTFSYGGGCGIDVSKLAPNGALVNNAAKQSSGAVSFMDLYSQVTGLISQNGRRGALMISMDVNHPDIKEFIHCKSDLTRVTKANISVKIDDKFMEAVKSGGTYTCKFKRDETGEIFEREIDAKELFREIAYNVWDMAEPGVLFWDTINKNNYLDTHKEFKYAGVNPCVTGDTLILTDCGYYPIKDIVGFNTNIWNGYEWSNVVPQITGYNQPIRQIETSDGAMIKCTDYHKFILEDGTRKEAKDLVPGDKLIKHEFPVIPGWIDMEDKIAYTKGFMAGDGCIDTRGRWIIYLYGEKKKLISYIDYDRYVQNEDRDTLQISDKPYYVDSKFWVPNVAFKVRTRLEWLAGIIDSDGSLNDTESGSISITSINADFLYSIKLLLNTLGCNATVSLNREESDRLMPDGKGGLKEYHCQPCYRLLISGYYVAKLMSLGFKTHRVPLISTVKRCSARFITVKSNIDIGVADTVYCVNEPKNHSVIFNGIITANCGEEPLPAYGACLLGSLNLSEFVDNPFTENASFNYDEFKKAIYIAIEELNKILDEGSKLHPLKQQTEMALEWRPIGLGVMGIADMLIKLGLVYGSKKSVELCKSLSKFLAYNSLEASADLAIKDGAFPKWNYESFLNSTMCIKMGLNIEDNLIKDKISKTGLRNSQLLTIAPTGTLSTLLGISGGIEPIFANSYTRKTESLHNEDVYYKVYTPIVEQYMKTHNINDEENLPAYFIVSQNIDFHTRIDMQSAWQEFIDASISSTVNLPESATVDDVEELYMYAWEKGLKGITVFRDNCRRVGVLTTEPKKEETDIDKEPLPKVENISADSLALKRGEIKKVSDDCIGYKRKLMTGCGSLHCIAMFDKYTGELLETYLSKGSTGGCNNFMVGLSRTISLAARGGICIEDIVDQLKSTGACPSYATRRATKGDTSIGACCPMAVGNAILDMYNEHNKLGKYAEKAIGEKSKNVDFLKTLQNKKKKTILVVNEDMKCPTCGDILDHEGGCDICRSCGWTKCS